MKTVKVKNVRIGEGMPKICVPVTGSNIENIKKQAKNIMMSPADLVELRADYLTNVRDEASLRMVIAVLKRELEGRPILFTLRTSDEGGCISVAEGEYADICSAAIDSGDIDLIDLEFSCSESMRERLRARAASKGVKVVFSFHDFESTPSEAVLLNRLKDMELAGADIVKAAVMPKGTEDVLAVMDVSSKFASISGVPLIMISMGSLGLVSRISGEAFGSAVTFGKAGAGSAPGQINADELDRVIRVFHENAEIGRGRADGVKREAPDACGSKGGNIVLVGFMGVGKSTVADALREKTGYRAVETDEIISQSEGMSIPDIFDQHGEPYFRALESKTVKKLSEDSAEGPLIISCGGGTVLNRENVEALRKGGTIVLLSATPDTIYERVKRVPSSRPVLTRYMSRGYISWLMKQREEAYIAAADFVVDVNDISSDRVADEIISLI